VQRILTQQIVVTGIGLLRIALFPIAVLVKQFQQGRIDLLKIRKPLVRIVVGNILMIFGLAFERDFLAIVRLLLFG